MKLNTIRASGLMLGLPILGSFFVKEKRNQSAHETSPLAAGEIHLTETDCYCSARTIRSSPMALISRILLFNLSIIIGFFSSTSIFATQEAPQIPSSTQSERMRSWVCNNLLGNLLGFHPESRRWAVEYTGGQHVLYGSKTTFSQDHKGGEITAWRKGRNIGGFGELERFLGSYVHVVEPMDRAMQDAFGIPIPPKTLAIGFVIKVDPTGLTVVRADGTETSIQLRPTDVSVEKTLSLAGAEESFLAAFRIIPSRIQTGYERYEHEVVAVRHDMVVNDIHDGQYNPFQNIIGQPVTVRYFDVEKNGYAGTKGKRTGIVVAQDFSSITIDQSGGKGEIKLFAPIDDDRFLQVRVK